VTPSRPKNLRNSRKPNEIKVLSTIPQKPHDLTFTPWGFMLRAMRFSALFSALLLALAVQSAHAAPTEGTDDMTRFLSERGFIERIGEVGHKLNLALLSWSSCHGLWVFPTAVVATMQKQALTAVALSGAMYQQTAGLLLPRKAEQQAAATQKD
jgi:hypothetical protein